MCNECAFHWEVIRVIPNFTIEPSPSTAPRVEAENPGCCIETFDCVYDGPCYCGCARCSESRRSLIECTCDYDSRSESLWLVDDCPYHDENGRILSPITACPSDCRCVRCIGYREVDTR